MSTHTPRRDGIKKQWLDDCEVKAISEFLSAKKNKQAYLSFTLLLSSGVKYSRLKKALLWGSYNSRLHIIRVGDRSIRVTKSVAKALLMERDNATSENSPVLTIHYKRLWDSIESACVRLKIEPSGVLTLRNTYARRHWQTYQSKHRLKRDLGLSSLRHIPKAIFQDSTPPALFVGVL